MVGVGAFFIIWSELEKFDLGQNLNSLHYGSKILAAAKNIFMHNPQLK
jgi:hypothetical protein